MRTYKNYEIQMTGDVSSASIPCGSCVIPFFQAISKSEDGSMNRINLGVSMEDVSNMSTEDADNFIYEEACKIIDDILASQDNSGNTDDTDEENFRDENQNEPTLSGEGSPASEEESELQELIGGSDPFSETAQRKVAMMVKQSMEAVKITEQIWEQRRKEYKLKDDQMKALYQINEQNKVPIPEKISDEERIKWDHFNGIDKITSDEINEIFGLDHPISIAPSINDSIYLIKETMKDFFGYLSALREYKNINNAYLQYIDMGEMKQIHELETIMENETDPEKKELMKKSIDEYYNNKYLNFLADPLDQKEINAIVEAYGDDKKIEYWLNRAKDKLRQVKIDPKFILEISKFEKRFLPEEYHHLSNITLVYFLRKITYTDMSNASNLERTRVVAMVIALDQLIGNRMHDDYRSKVLNNVKALLDQFSDIIRETYGDKIKEEGENNE